MTLWQIACLFGTANVNSANKQTAVKVFEKTGIWPINQEIFQDRYFSSSLATDIAIDEEAPRTPSAWPARIGTLEPMNAEPNQIDEERLLCSAWDTKIIISMPKNDFEQEFTTEEHSTDESDVVEADSKCLYCNELYSFSVEENIACQNCLKWSRNSCAEIDSDDYDTISIYEFC
ncbi:hypothetical protein ILUMI_04205 [Ignelater luminosus]|uniref:Uncharacterized protein n=1 Tax=Ignelater luminosus TaxID=2038154 RepID=A0A8K0DD17_IGNLU|nr:hypothetical protein ILUMI_04205 [Ignelater luminosus]